MGAPAVQVEIAFDSNFRTPAADRTWTDVSAYLADTVSISYGRSDPVSAIGPSTCSFRLRNEDGRFTAGKSSSPYYPNVKLDRPVRVTVTPDGGTPSVRYVGYIDAWPVEWPMGTDLGSVYASISATSRTGRLAARNALESFLAESSKATGAEQLWSLDDASESIQAQPYFDNQWGPLSIAGSGDALTFTGNGVQFAGGEYLSGPASIVTATYPQFTIAATFAATARPTSADGVTGVFAGISLDSTLDAELIDGVEHRYVLTYDSGAVTQYVDGVSYGSGFRAVDSVPLIAGFSFVGTIRDLAFWPMVLSGSDVTVDHQAATGGLGLRTDEMLELLAAFAEIPSAEVDLPTGATTMGGMDTAGLAVVDAMRVVETTEGGLLIDGRDGHLILQGRRQRSTTPSGLTVDMEAEEVAADYSPVLDRGLLRNDVTGTNAATSLGGNSVSFRVFDEDSQDDYGVAGGSVEINAEDPNEANAAASWIVARYAQPIPRVPQMSVDILGLNDGSRADEFLAAFVSDRITLSGRPSQDSSAEVDLFIEGGSESYSPDAASITWNLSPVTIEDSLFLIDTDAVNGPEFIAY